MRPALLYRIAIPLATAGFLLFAGCGISRKSNSSNDAARICSSVPFSQEEPALTWVKSPAPSQEFLKQMVLPGRFGTYRIADDTLNRFFSYARRQGVKSGFVIPLPAPLDCQFFELTSSGVMSEALAAKFPDLSSLKGFAVHDPAVTIRLDYDGSKMHAEVTWGDKVYLAKPVDVQDGIVYIVYEKKDSGDLKQPFEEKANPGMMQSAQPGMQASPLPVR